MSSITKTNKMTKLNGTTPAFKPSTLNPYVAPFNPTTKAKTPVVSLARPPLSLSEENANEDISEYLHIKSTDALLTNSNFPSVSLYSFSTPHLLNPPSNQSELEELFMATPNVQLSDSKALCEEGEEEQVFFRELHDLVLANQVEEKGIDAWLEIEVLLEEGREAFRAEMEKPGLEEDARANKTESRDEVSWRMRHVAAEIKAREIKGKSESWLKGHLNVERRKKYEWTKGHLEALRKKEVLEVLRKRNSMIETVRESIAEK